MQYIAATCSFNPYLDLANDIKLFCDTTSSQHSLEEQRGSAEDADESDPPKDEGCSETVDPNGET